MGSRYKSFIAEKGIDDETYDNKKTALFKIQGTNRDNMQAIQVDQVRTFSPPTCKITVIKSCTFKF